jgi:hypothetical protein
MPLYGGTPGQFATVNTRANPPTRVYRVIPGPVWWTLLYWPWRQFLAAVACGTPGVRPPQLAHRGAAGVFVTDRISLRGCDDPGHFAWRLSLSPQDQLDCQLFGCAVVRFDLPQPHALLALPGLPGTNPGLTAGGAREWLLAGNIDLANTMQVHYVDRTHMGPRHFRLPL